MPIYAYRCASCGFEKDILQKLSDAVLTDCPACHEPAFQKQVTAAGFQLKGSGWYATDFRNPPAAPKSQGAASEADGSSPSESTSDTGKAVEPGSSAPAAPAKSETAAKSEAGVSGGSASKVVSPKPSPSPDSAGH